MRILATGMTVMLGLGLAACHDDMAVGAPLANGARAVAVLHDADGAEVGRATATEVAGGLRFTIDAKGLPHGTHGAHVHTIGLCTGPDFTSAGGHWNPTAMKHGAMNPQGPHEGDLPNLLVGTDGRGGGRGHHSGRDDGGVARCRWVGPGGTCQSGRSDDRPFG